MLRKAAPHRVAQHRWLLQPQAGDNTSDIRGHIGDVTVSGKVAQKLQQLAQLRQQNVDTLLETLLNQAWRQQETIPDDSSTFDDESEDVATPEMQAYIALHPMLKEKYFGQYVAVYQGALVDHDANHEALYKRIDAQYPNEFVWINPVEEEAIPTLTFRSPRIEWNEPA